MNRRRNLFILLGVLVVAVLVGVAVRPRSDAVTVRAVRAAYGSYQTKLPETGVVQRPQTQTLAALVGGNVGAIFVHAGAHVAAGTLLLSIDNPQIVNTEASAHQAYLAAQGRARTIASTNATLPAQNRSSIVQAEAAVENARFTLSQAIQDQRAGTQSGLGYGGTSATQQRAAADTALAQRETDLREARRIAAADQELYAQKAVAKNTLDQDVAKLDQAQAAYNQAKADRNETYAQIARQSPVLADRVHADQDAVTQAEAALASARANAAQDKSGDVQAAQADAQKAYDDWRYAAAQVARLRITAPFAGVVQTITTQTGDTLRPLQPGDAVSVNQALVTLSAEGDFVVRAKVDEQDIANVRPGQAAIVSGEDLGTTTLPGHVLLVGAVAQKSDDPSNTARQVVTTIALERSVPYLRDGMSVDVDIVTLNATHVLAVPIDAIRRDDANAPFVLLLIDGRATKRSVTLGPTNDVQAIVRSGVRPGDMVIADRNLGIAPGLRVTPTAMPSAAASPAP